MSKESNQLYFTIDWADFKDKLRQVIVENKSANFAPKNKSAFERWAKQSGSFSGVSLGQMQRWLTDGYQTESIHGLAEFTPPIREKRKLRFNEEGDEFHLDLAYSGMDNYMSEWTKRESIPGVAIEAGIMFSGGTDSKVVAAYETWICKVAYSLESAGIDTQITLDFPSWNLGNAGGDYSRISAGSGKLYHNIVRVKKENEASDFLSWSAMLSPAALRNFGFCLGVLHCENRGERCSSSFGRGVPERRNWKCRYDADRRVIVIENHYMHAGSFPAEDMTRQFRECLREMQGKAVANG